MESPVESPKLISFIRVILGLTNQKLFFNKHSRNHLIFRRTRFLSLSRYFLSNQRRKGTTLVNIMDFYYNMLTVVPLILTDKEVHRWFTKEKRK